MISLQNIAIRIITFSDFLSSTNHHYSSLKILNLRNHQVELQNCLLVHSQLNNTIPLPLKDMFTLKKDIHIHETRNQLLLAHKHYRTSRYGLNSIQSRCIRSWNKVINLEILNETEWPLSRYCMKKKMKTHLLND